MNVSFSNIQLHLPVSFHRLVASSCLPLCCVGISQLISSLCCCARELFSGDVQVVGISIWQTSFFVHSSDFISFLFITALVSTRSSAYTAFCTASKRSYLKAIVRTKVAIALNFSISEVKVMIFFTCSFSNRRCTGESCLKFDLEFDSDPRVFSHAEISSKLFRSCSNSPSSSINHRIDLFRLDPAMVSWEEELGMNS